MRFRKSLLNARLLDVTNIFTIFQSSRSSHSVQVLTSAFLIYIYIYLNDFERSQDLISFTKVKRSLRTLVHQLQYSNLSITLKIWIFRRKVKLGLYLKHFSKILTIFPKNWVLIFHYSCLNRFLISKIVRFSTEFSTGGILFEQMFKIPNDFSKTFKN